MGVTRAIFNELGKIPSNKDLLIIEVKTGDITLVIFFMILMGQLLILLALFLRDRIIEVMS
jgi:hypothetical protein